MVRDRFLFLFAWRDALQGVPKEPRCEIYEAIIEYALSGKIPELDSVGRMAFNFIKMEIDRNSKSWEDKCNKRQTAGRKSAQAKKEAKAKKDSDKQAEKDIITESKEESLFDAHKEESTKFVPPTLDDVMVYFKDKSFTSSPEEFFSYYKSNGWLIGSNPMADWQAAADRWEMRQSDFKKVKGRKADKEDKKGEDKPITKKEPKTASFKGFGSKDK